jgi:hypothetical protein
MTKSLSCILLIASGIILASCSDKYLVHTSQYNFKSEIGLPDYGNINYWAAHPWKKDPSDSLPVDLQNEMPDSLVDVFFLHPTTYTKHPKEGKMNAPIDDDYINAKTDYSTILYQASVFNQHARVFAPRYRQANISTFFNENKEGADSVFAIAYTDIKTAFEYYLANWNNNRPIIIASHSQGSKLALRLLKEYFEEKPLQRQLVAAYTVGWAVPKDFFTSLKMCEDSLQTGCICSWRTVRKNHIPFYLKNENGNSFVTNPLTWKTNTSYISRKQNKGSVLLNFSKVYKHTAGAGIHNGMLWIKKPKFPWSFLYARRNYHIADINLYYMNIRENVAQRINAFNKQ